MLLAALILWGSAVSPQCCSCDLSKIVEDDCVCASCPKKVAFFSSKKEKSKKVAKSRSKKRSANKIIVKTLAPKAEKTPNIYFNNGANEFKIGGDTAIENFYEKNAFMLNGNLPDENCYFRHTLDLNFDMVYGKEKFGHKALETYLNFRHRGVWGRSQSYADRDSVFSDKAGIKIADAITGQHVHASGRNLPWISEAWLLASFNAMLGLKTENVHTIKLGWFPFDLGRGIALGRWYGANRAVLGLYNYDKEDKWAPGVNINGSLIKDKLTYDLYYAKIEERSKSLSDNIDITRTQWLDQSGIKWRGTHKDNDLYAARLKLKAFKNESYGTLDVEPYVYYNNGIDQWYESEPDEKMQFGAYGIGAEYAINNFEFGAEVAANYGQEKVVAFDRNKVVIKADKITGALTQYYDHIVTSDPAAAVTGKVYTKPALAAKTKLNDEKINAYSNRENGVKIGNNGPIEFWNDGIKAGTLPTSDVAYNTPTTANRFRPAFTNELRGWMFVTDAAYKLPTYNLKFAVAYGYASGDANPHENEVNKTYKGFIGLNESYCGKRVQSVFLLDKRLLKMPTALTRNSDELTADLAFTDMHLLGAGTTWTPTVGGKKVNINPNMLFFWKDSTSKKVIVGTGGANDWSASETENARKYMGSELNLVTDIEVLKDLKVFGKFAVFLPGSYFTDVAGVPLDDDFFVRIDKDVAGYQAKDFRLGNETAYHANVGLEYKF